MTLRILGKISSINVRKVLWTCAELDIQFERVDSDPELLAHNPNAKVPVIRDGEFVLWESNSICRHLARKRSHSTLLPEAAEARALVEQWMDWQANELNPAWRYAFYALARNSMAHIDPTAIAASVESWNAHMGILDRHLQGAGQFMTGEFFTLADVVVGLSTHRWLHTPLERPHYDALLGYYQRLTVRPAFRAHIDATVP